VEGETLSIHLRCGSAQVWPEIIDGRIKEAGVSLEPQGTLIIYYPTINLCHTLRYCHLHQRALLISAKHLSHYMLLLCAEGSYLHWVVLNINNILMLTIIHRVSTVKSTMTSGAWFNLQK
jgi:hypothetical protein